MEKYDYRKAVKDDVIEYIKNNNLTAADFQNLADCQERLHDYLWTADSVTGNGSGSYTFCTYKAEENICHNLDLLGEALEEFGCDGDVLKNGAEWCDVTIRCYLLVGAIDEAIEELGWEWDE